MAALPACNPSTTETPGYRLKPVGNHISYPCVRRNVPVTRMPVGKKLGM